MSSGHYAQGKKAWGICGRCGQRALLNDLVFDGYYPSLRVHERCYDSRHPQDRLAPVNDRVALWRPSPEDYPIEPPVLELELGSVILTWSRAVSYHVRIETYTVYRAVGDAEAVQIAQYTNQYTYDAELVSDTLTHTDEQTQPGSTYHYYVVAAASDQRFSANSNIVTVSITAPGPPVLSGELISGDASLSWTASAQGSYDLDFYTLQRAVTAESVPAVEGDFANLATVQASDPLQYSDEDVVGGNRYSYRVKVTDVDGNDSEPTWSNVVALDVEASLTNLVAQDGCAASARGYVSGDPGPSEGISPYYPYCTQARGTWTGDLSALSGGAFLYVIQWMTFAGGRFSILMTDGGLAPPQNFFSSVTFTDRTGTPRTFLSSAATSDEYFSNGQRHWEWSHATQLFDDNGEYNITFNP
jgi:hypothetical protein